MEQGTLLAKLRDLTEHLTSGDPTAHSRKVDGVMRVLGPLHVHSGTEKISIGQLSWNNNQVMGTNTLLISDPYGWQEAYLRVLDLIVKQ